MWVGVEKKIYLVLIGLNIFKGYYLKVNFQVIKYTGFDDLYTSTDFVTSKYFEEKKSFGNKKKIFFLRQGRKVFVAIFPCFLITATAKEGWVLCWLWDKVLLWCSKESWEKKYE